MASRGHLHRNCFLHFFQTQSLSNFCFLQPLKEGLPAVARVVGPEFLPYPLDIDRREPLNRGVKKAGPAEKPQGAFSQTGGLGIGAKGFKKKNYLRQGRCWIGGGGKNQKKNPQGGGKNFFFFFF